MKKGCVAYSIIDSLTNRHLTKRDELKKLKNQEDLQRYKTRTRELDIALREDILDYKEKALDYEWENMTHSQIYICAGCKEQIIDIREGYENLLMVNGINGTYFHIDSKLKTAYESAALWGECEAMYGEIMKVNPKQLRSLVLTERENLQKEQEKKEALKLIELCQDAKKRKIEEENSKALWLVERLTRPA